MQSFQTFKDLSVTFKKHPVTDDLVSVKDKTAIAQSISNLLMTNRGERPFQPRLGSGIRDTLFEPLDYATAGMLKGNIIEVLKDYEPRISILNLSCEPDYDTNGYYVEIQYEIVGREDTPVAVEFFLERTR